MYIYIYIYLYIYIYIYIYVSDRNKCVLHFVCGGGQIELRSRPPAARLPPMCPPPHAACRTPHADWPAAGLGPHGLPWAQWLFMVWYCRLDHAGSAFCLGHSRIHIYIYIVIYIYMYILNIILQVWDIYVVYLNACIFIYIYVYIHVHPISIYHIYMTIYIIMFILHMYVYILCI